MKKGVFLALLLMLLAAFPALAEDVYYADASQGGSVTSDKGYLSRSGYPFPMYPTASQTGPPGLCSLKKRSKPMHAMQNTAAAR